MQACAPAAVSSEREYSFYFQVNDENPWVISGIDLSTFVKLKHLNDFALVYVNQLFDRNEMPRGYEPIEKIFKSPDGIDFACIYDKEVDDDADKTATNMSTEEKLSPAKNMSVEESSSNTDGTWTPTASGSSSSDSQDGRAGTATTKINEKVVRKKTNMSCATKPGRHSLPVKEIVTKKTLKTQFKPTKPKKSDVWMYFVKTTIGGTCKLCQMDVRSSGNTTNLSKHLVRHHQRDTEGKFAPRAMNTARDEFRAMFRMSRDTDIDDPDDPVSSTPSDGTSNTTELAEYDVGKNFQPRIDKTVDKVSAFKAGGSKASALLNAIVYMIAQDDLPLSTTEKKGFKYFLSIACPLYTVPKRAAVTAAVDRKYEVLSAILREKLAEIDAFTLTADIWTEVMTSHSFLGCTAHFLDDNELRSVVLDVAELNERHTSEYIQEKFESICGSWNIPKETVTAIVTDNGANMLKAAYDTFGANRHLPCFAHTLNLVMTKVTNQIEPLKGLIERVKNIVTYFKHTNPADLLRKAQTNNGKRLLQNVPTRWNSTFYMLDRFLELLDVVTSVLLTLPQSPPLFTAPKVAILRDSMQILQPAEFVTRELSGELYVTTSMVIPTIYCLKKAIEEVPTTTEIGTTLKCAILKELDKRFSGIEMNSLCAIATILDPRYKRLHLSALSAAKMIDKVNVLLRRSKPQTDCLRDHLDPGNNSVGSKIWKHHTEIFKLRKNFDPEMQVSGGLDIDLKQYLASETIPLTADPIKYWVDRKENSRQLASIALKYLSTVATSVPCERAFSVAGNVTTPKRNKLSGEHLARLIFLKSLKIDEWRL